MKDFLFSVLPYILAVILIVIFTCFIGVLWMLVIFIFAPAFLSSLK